MPQIFHPSMNTISRMTVFGALLLIAAAVAIGARMVRSAYWTEVGVVREQPVPFSHQHHVGDVGLDCRFCHTSVETSASAGMPSTEVCIGCHTYIWSQSALLEPVRESIRTGEPIAWTRVHDEPDYAYFNHSIHIHKGIGCTTCHGQVDRMPLMWRAESLSMKWCLDCHRDPSRFVRPRDEVFNLDWQPSNDERADELILQYHIESETDCSTCHR